MRAGQKRPTVFQQGLTIRQVVHDYGSICQAVSSLATELKAPIPPEDYEEFNLCLDDAIASAVAEYAGQQETAANDASTERLGVLAHELRNLLNCAVMAHSSIKQGVVGHGGGTGAVLERSLTGMRILLDRSFAQVRLDANTHSLVRLSVASVICEVEASVSMIAGTRGDIPGKGCVFTLELPRV